MTFSDWNDTAATATAHTRLANDGAYPTTATAAAGGKNASGSSTAGGHRPDTHGALTVPTTAAAPVTAIARPYPDAWR